MSHGRRTAAAEPGRCPMTKRQSMNVIGATLAWLSAVAAALLFARAWRAWRWHHRGAGEHAARAEYARIRRECPDTAEARLAEADFIRYSVGLRPGAARYLIAALAMLLIALPASCTLMADWPWD